MVYKVVGDALQAAFPSAPAAVAAWEEGRALSLEVAVAEALALGDKIVAEGADAIA